MSRKDTGFWRSFLGSVLHLRHEIRRSYQICPFYAHSLSGIFGAG